MKTPSIRRVSCVLAVLTLGASVALAQPRRQEAVDLTQVRPPSPSKQDTPPTLRSYLLLGLLIAGAVGANTIPSKRGHQD